MGVSVCVAAYNGASYIARQVLSILDELGPDDEVIVVDDASTDDTVKRVEEIGDARIRLYRNEANQREVLSFSRGILLARNDFIFLSDQDDIWIRGRVAAMVNRLRMTGAALVTTNFTWIDAEENPVDVPFDGVASSSSSRHIRNVLDIFIGKTNYFGCAMAFRRELIGIIAPIPQWVESHDLWIALAANLLRANVHMDEPTLRKRLHGSNATSTVSKRSVMKKVWSRVVFSRSLAVLQARRMVALFAERRR